MCIRVTASRVLNRVALVVLMAVTAAGCGSADRLTKPRLTASTENQNELVGDSQPISTVTNGQNVGNVQSPNGIRPTVPRPNPVRVVTGPDKEGDTEPGPGPEGDRVAETGQDLEGSKAELPPVDVASFRWPVHGRIIASFGTTPSGHRNEGINLAVPQGTLVKAAEAGTVIYAGEGVKSYGKLILIGHGDGWVSAYAHNSEINVRKGDAIRRGQTIAAAGMTGSVNSPQLHFELRKGRKPVNPLDYLTDS